VLPRVGIDILGWVVQYIIFPVTQLLIPGLG
jgi:hypothetical protein